MSNIQNPTELLDLCSAIAHSEDAVSVGLIHAALRSIQHALDARLHLMERAEDREVVDTMLQLRLLAFVLIRRLDGADQVRQAWIFQMVDERINPFASALLLLDLDGEQHLRYHGLQAYELDHDRWWGRYFSPEWRMMSSHVACTVDELSNDHAVARMVQGGASETKARWCMELAEEALIWRYDMYRRSACCGDARRDYLFACADEHRPRAVWIENGGRPLEHAVRALAERMAKTSTETLKRFAGYLASEWSPSVGVPVGL